MDAIYICSGFMNRYNMSYTKQFITEYTGRFKFNACSGDLFTKSPRGQKESYKVLIESPLCQIEPHSIQIESQRVSIRDLNRIAI